VNTIYNGKRGQASGENCKMPVNEPRYLRSQNLLQVNDFMFDSVTETTYWKEEKQRISQA